MKKIIFLILFFTALYLSNCTSGHLLITADQEKIRVEKWKVEEAIQWEQKINAAGKRHQWKGILFEFTAPLQKEYQFGAPLVFQRAQKGPLPLHVEYFYSLPDSTLRFVIYDWERAKYSTEAEKEKAWKEEPFKKEVYQEKYESLKAKGEKQFGTPKTEDQDWQKMESVSERGDFLIRLTEWETRDYDIQLYMVFAYLHYSIQFRFYRRA